MVFRKDNKTDAFQRQISALRQQLGTEDEGVGDDAEEFADEVEETGTGDDTSGVFESPVKESTRHYVYGAEPTTQVAESAAPVAAATVIPGVDASSTVVARDTVWKGEIESQSTVHINGVYEGSLKSRDSVYIAEEADVNATIAAAHVIVAGQVQGTIRCSARFEVLSTGRVSGDVEAPSLIVHEGAVMNGQFRMAAAATETTAPSQVVSRRSARGTA